MRGSLSTLYDSHWEPTIIKNEIRIPSDDTIPMAADTNFCLIMLTNGIPGGNQSGNGYGIPDAVKARAIE